MQQSLSIRTTLLLTIGGLALLIALLVMHKTYESWGRLEDAKNLKQFSLLGTSVYQFVGAFSQERGIVYTMLLSPDQDFVDSLKPDLLQARKDADRLLARAKKKIYAHVSTTKTDSYAQIDEQLKRIEELRRKTDMALAKPFTPTNHALAEQWFEESTLLMEQFQYLIVKLYEGFSNLSEFTTRRIRFNHILSIINEYAGRERAFNGGLIIGKIAPTQEDQARQWRWQGTIDLSWKMANSYISDSEIRAYFEEAKSHYYSSFDMMHNVTQPAGNGETTYLLSEALWLQLAEDALQSLSELSQTSLDEVLEFSNKREKAAQQEIAMHILLLIFALGLCVYSFHVITRRVLSPVHDMVEALYTVMQGKPVNLNIATIRRADEIGKLASVLVDYQASSEKIKKASIELARHVRALERSNKELDDFAYIASHDLKEPLRGLHNHARFLLEDNEDKLDEDSVNRLHRLAYLTQRMEKLINDLLYFSRLGRQDMAIQPTDLNEIIHDIESTLEHLLTERNGKILIPTPLPTAICDKTRIAEVFRNLITNALKYNESPEKIIEIGFIKQHNSPEGELVKNVFYVKDNGIGIAEEFKTEVFRIFRRLNASKGQEDGTGVGLTFVKKIIERHGGAIWLDSTPGKGTTFYFTLGDAAHDNKPNT